VLGGPPLTETGITPRDCGFPLAVFKKTNKPESESDAASGDLQR
jgi:hypothetical protein